MQAQNFWHLDRVPEAIRACHRSMILDDTRRDAFFMLAQFYIEREQWRSALVYLAAAGAVPYNPEGFLNDMRLYTWALPDRLSVCYQRLGKHDVARSYWLEALRHLPDGPDGARILANGKWMFDRGPLGAKNAECGKDAPET